MKYFWGHVPKKAPINMKCEVSDHFLPCSKPNFGYKYEMSDHFFQVHSSFDLTFFHA